MRNNSKIVNLNKVLKGMDSFSQDVEQEVDETIKEYAYKIEAQAKSLAPVDTGYMRNSIFTETDYMEATISVTAEYAIFVEFGTSKQLPQPFFFISLQMFEAQLMAELRRITGGR